MLTEALKEVAGIATQLQSSLIRLENFQKLTELQRDLIGIENLTTPGRVGAALCWTLLAGFLTSTVPAGSIAGKQNKDGRTGFMFPWEF